jgi:hypothetical protein
MLRKYFALRRFRRNLYVGQHVLVMRNGANKCMKIVNLNMADPKMVLLYSFDTAWEAHMIKNLYPTTTN